MSYRPAARTRANLTIVVVGLVSCPRNTNTSYFRDKTLAAHGVEHFTLRVGKDSVAL